MGNEVNLLSQNVAVMDLFRVSRKPRSRAVCMAEFAPGVATPAPESSSVQKRKTIMISTPALYVLAML